MQTLIGKYCKDIKIFTDNVEEEALQTIYGIANHPVFKDTRIRIMPDCHQGKGIVIGFTAPLGEYINPSHVGCVDCDTEVLTKNGWIKISDYKGEEILEYNPETDKASFNKPIAYIKKPCDEFYHFYNKNCSLNQMVSEEHNMLVYYKFSGEKTYRFKKVHPKFLASLPTLEKGYYRFKSTFNIDSLGLNISDNLIRIDIMIQADGYVGYRKTLNLNYVSLHLRKDRKIKRAKELLDNEKIPYKEIVRNDGSTYIEFHIDPSFNKDLSKYYLANSKQLSIVAEESLKWDGYEGYRSYYSTTNKKNADIIQYAFAATGNRSSIYSRVDDRNLNWTKLHNVIKTKKQYATYSRFPTKVKSKDGYKYCFTTNTGSFVCRRGDNIFITGNCDIGCMMTTLFYEGLVKEDDYSEIEHKVRLVIPTGFEINKKKVFNDKDFFKFMNIAMRKARSQWSEMVEGVNVTEKYVTEMLKRIGMNEGVFYKSLGSLGGGNHFLELGKHDGHSVWTIHCGSRNLGQKVFKYWDKISKKPAISKGDFREGIEEIKRKCKDKLKLASLIKEYKESQNASKPLGYLYGENMKGYLTDVFFCQAYAEWNHKCIGEAISDIMRKKGYGKVIDQISTTHNYISPKDHIIRKGSIASYEGERLIIPFNMRDGLAVCEGKSNPDWNYSAPHGAGRIMSRSKAKENIDLEEFKESMKGVYSTTVCSGTIDESPMVYKPMEEIIKNIEPTAKILYFIKPCINIKSTEGE